MLSQAPSKQQIARMVEEEIHHILEEKAAPGDQTPQVAGEQRLGSDLGLTSLELAQLVFALESRTGADPFQELVAITSVRTVADLCSAYERFLAGEKNDGAEAAALLESKRRAEARGRRTEGR